MSMATPVSVRSHQYGRMAFTESSHSACAISMKPCWRPCAVRIKTMAAIPVVMSQKPAFASRKLEGDECVTRGHT